MYLSWSLIHAGIMILVSSVWLLVLLPIALVYVHNVDIRREEKFLQEKFGAEYDEYRAMVRRYL